MERAKAFAILGLARDRNAVRDRLRLPSEMKEVHPDGSSPDEEQAKLVNEAHLVATAAADLVLVSLMMDVVRRNTAAIERSTQAAAASETVRQVVTQHVGHLERSRTAVDLTRLILAKGRENHVIEETTIGPEHEYTYGYRLAPARRD